MTASPKPGAIDFDRFSVPSSTEEPGETVGLRAEIRLWNARSFDQCASAFLAAYDELLAPVGAELKWYQTYEMDRFSPVTAKTFGMPRTWLKSGKANVARSLFLKGPDELHACGKVGLEFSYYPQGALYQESNAPYIRRFTPGERLERDPAGFVSLAVSLAEKLPFLCGTVGYSLVYSPFAESEGQREAFALAVRHPGIHISTDHATWPLRDPGGIETVSWLTLVGEGPLQRLGGRAKVRKALESEAGVEAIETANGLVIRAGERAEIGDVNRRQTLPLVRHVYRVLEAEIEPITADFRPLQLDGTGNEDDERTMRWLRRFEA